jgi:hypothetical protein
MQRDPMPGSQMVQKEYRYANPFIGNSHAQALGGSASPTPRSGSQMLGPYHQLAPRGPGLSFIDQQDQQQQQIQDGAGAHQQFNFGNFQQQMQMAVPGQAQQQQPGQPQQPQQPGVPMQYLRYLAVNKQRAHQQQQKQQLNVGNNTPVFPRREA